MTVLGFLVMSDSIPSRLRRFLTRSGVSQEEAAKRMGYSHASGIQRYLSETDYTKEYVSVQFAKKFADAVAGRGPDPVSVDEVMELAGIIPPFRVNKIPTGASGAEDLLPNADLRATIDMPRVLAMPVDVPVYGVAVGGSDGDFSLNGEIVDRVRRPPGLMGNTKAFGVFVRGDSMEPRHQQGDLLYVDPVRPARAGDDVLVELKPLTGGEPGPAFIKQLVSQTPLRLVVRQFNPAKDITLPGARVLRICRILKLADLLGV